MQVQCPIVPLNKKKCTQKVPISTFHDGERCQTVHPGHSSSLLSHETGSVSYPTVSCRPDPEDLKPKGRQEHGPLHSFIFQLPVRGCHRGPWSVVTLKASSSTLVRNRAQPAPPPTLTARRGNVLTVQVIKGN